MSEGVNRVALLGNLGADPELRVTNGGTPVLNIRFATNERYKDSSGEWQEKVEWHRVKVWGKRAESLAKILGKGDQLYIEGRLETQTYEKDGEKRSSTDIVALQVIPLKYRGEEKQQTTTSKPANGNKGKTVRKPSDDDTPPF